ncbi:hypothetical protein K402DRAFT_408875 [Aulographum hederae CBS 113979]|uniref:Zn(2)-C6 fungal-type domain-containing protein n=1 Tax=Aulographum hederae CBS 113979 TaxID=1176131 RepID=A0A6G1GJ38_9PEZI|nr:hypothetical protein K402DRAFT_408875 [Aulographum hederae CBS 113979]
MESVLHQHSSNPFGTSDRIQKNSTSHPSGAGGGLNNGLNPRSCITCRRRKVKCDKKQPCSNCQKAQIDCIFPAPGRAPRRPRRTPENGELLERLRKLEGVVLSLGAQIDEEPRDGSQLDHDKDSDEDLDGEEETDKEKIIRAKNELRELIRKKQENERKNSTGLTGLENRFGRLVVDHQGRSRYINPSFWANLSDEVEDIKGILNNESSEDEFDYPSPITSHTSQPTQHFIFGYSSQLVDMVPLHPTPSKIPKYWAIFKENIDPLVKVLHVPSLEPTILRASERLDKIHKGLESLLFAIYYGVATSLTREECLAQLGEEKDELISRYRFGVEQALARADCLQSDEIVVLQAFVIFMMCLRRNDDARVIWTLCGVVVRMAQTLGIHRDGSHFNLNPFDIEMRRRLWWALILLDARSSEDHGCDPTIVESQFDTKLPLNVNDDQLTPDMKDFPEPLIGCTQMTFNLIRFEIANTLRKIQYTPPGPKRCNEFFATVSLEQKEQWVNEAHKHMEERYLKHCDMSVPLYWVTATVARLIMSKMWLMIYHPYQRLDGGSSLPQETRDKLFLTSLEQMEYSTLLETEARTKKWGWLFRTYVQWHAIAFLLTELCTRTKGEYVDRAWTAVEGTMRRRWGADSTSSKLKGHLWRPLRKLEAKARAARQRELEKDLSKSFPVPGAVLSMDKDQSLESKYPVGSNPTGSPTFWLKDHRSSLDGESPESSSNQPYSKEDLLAQRGLSKDALPTSQQSLETSREHQNTKRDVPGLIDTDDMFWVMTDADTAYQKRLNEMLQRQGKSPASQSNTLSGSDNSPLESPSMRNQSIPTTSGGNTINKAAPSKPYGASTTASTGPRLPGAANTNTNVFDPTNSTTTTNQPISLTADYNDLPEIDLGIDTNMDDPVNWANWDDMVKQFGMEVDLSQNENINFGPGVGGFQSWY